ncbi:MAG: nucleoside hydrolase-like domain-containing protein [Verrucomicrobiales bacterium]
MSGPFRPLRAALAFACVIVVQAPPSADAAEDAAPKRRLIVETDAGGDPDDEQSLVRFLLYANEWDIEGILCSRLETLRGENHNPEPTGLAIVQRLLRAYAEVHPRLIQHGAFPPPEALQSRTVEGYDDRDDGVRLIIEAVDRDDPRPIWFSNWGTNDGTTSSLKRALDRVLRDRGPDSYARFKDKLRLCSDDLFGEHTIKQEPPWKLWVYTKFPDMDGGRWYHRFGPLTATAGGFDLKRDLLSGHGPLAALYPTNTHLAQKEGDTPEFLYLIPNGLNEPDQPTWGSWAGRFGPQQDAGSRPYYWPNLRDTIGRRAHRDNTLLPWVAHIQNDFRARLDWCVNDFANANHPPRVAVTSSLRPTVRPGQRIALDASSSSDPDGEALAFHWRHYLEPGSYDGLPLHIENDRAAQASLVAPPVPAPRTVHVILTVTDDGDPPLTRYARVVITVDPAGE